MITLTDTGKEKIVDMLTEAGVQNLRVGLQGGGCSGFSYFMTFDEDKNEDDFILDLGDGLSVIVDSVSLTYLEGAEIDYKKDIMGESFVFNTPGVTSTCGCGSSVGF